MSEIEETVGRLERYWPDDPDTRALIASWRERGEALKAIADMPPWEEQSTVALRNSHTLARGVACAALNGEPE